MSRIVRWVVLLAMIFVCAANSQAQEVTIFLSSNDISDVAVGRGLVHWSSEGGVGLFRPGDSTYTLLTNADGLSSNHVSGVAIDSTGALWYAFETTDDGVLRIDTLGAWHWITTYGGLPEGEPVTSLDASGGRVWIGTAAGISFPTGESTVGTWYGGQGLLNGTVLATLFENNDSIWIGTHGGLSHRTSGGWEDHLVGLEVRALTEDGLGDLWAATSGGVYRRSAGIWTLTSSDTEVQSLILADTILWAGSTTGPARYDGGVWVAETFGLVGAEVSELAYDPGVGLWAGIRGEGIAWWNGNAWEPRLPSIPATNYLSSLDIAPDGELWGGTGTDGNQFPLPADVGTKGLVHYDGETWSNLRRWRSPLPSDNAYRVAVGSRGDVWVGTWGAGLLRFDAASGQWDTLSTASGDLLSNVISALVRGRNGEIWFAEYGRGIAVVDTNLVVTHFGQNDGLPTIYYRSMAVDSLGRVWAGSYGIEGGGADQPSLTRWDPTGGSVQLTVYPASVWGDSYPVHGLACAPDGGVWLGVEGGIAWTDGDDWIPVEQACAGSATGDIRSIAVDPAGGVWFATPHGLGEWRDDTWALYGTDSGGIAAEEVMSLVYDWSRRTLWIGTWGGGVSRWEFEIPDTTTDDTSVYAYPNPFRWDEGHQEITFQGLAPEAEIKIYTLDGEEVVALPPGETTWDATTQGSTPVASGLYVFVGKDARGAVQVGKVAVIR